MKQWELGTMDARPHLPQILSTTDAARAILLALPADERLQEHEVHERAWLVVIAGEIDVTSFDGTRVQGGAGLMVEFAPGERHQVTARSDARLLLFLAPWPGEGHPGAMTMEEKGQVRARAAEQNPG